MADVCLVRPPIIVPRWNQATIISPPLGLAYVAAAVEATGASVRAIDALGEAPNLMEPVVGDCIRYGLPFGEIARRVPADVKVIGVSAAFSFEWPAVKELISTLRARFPTTPIVLGGEHATAMPEFCLTGSSANAVVLGEGEATFASLVTHILEGTNVSAPIDGVVRRLPDGTLVHGGPSLRIRDIDGICRPAWHLFPIENYLAKGLGFGVNRGRSMPVLASRGCPYQCTFCSSPAMWTTRWIARDVKDLVSELEHYQKYYGATNFDFYDLTAIVKKQWIIEFCDEVRRRNLEFTWQLPSGTRSEAIDAEVATRLYTSGCRNLSYAPESGSKSVLKRIKKKITTDRMIGSIKSSVSAGINVKCNIMLGFPGETVREVRETFWFIVQMAWSGAHDLSIWAFSPYPGSELFRTLESQGKILIDDAYFDRLRSYADASRTTSFSEHLSDKKLRYLRTLGLIFFYMVSWGRHPWRPLRSLRNVFLGTVESRSEMVVLAAWKRLMQKPLRDAQ